MRLALLFPFLISPIMLQGQSLDSLLTFSTDTLVRVHQNKLDSIQGQFYAQSDSLKQSIKQELNALGSRRASIQTKIDSLQTLTLPTEKYSVKLDSIKAQQEKVVASLNQKMEDLKSKTVGQVKKLELPPELQEKVNSVTKSIEGFQLPVKDLNIPSLNLPDNPLKNLDGLTSSFKSLLVNIGDIDGLQNIQENLGGVSEITDQLGGYKEDLRNITNGNLDEVKQLPAALEQEAVGLSGVGEITKQSEVLNRRESFPFSVCS